MKRNKYRVSGPKVRYFQYNAGVVNRKSPFIFRIALPVFVGIGLLAGGGYFGLKQFDQQRPVVLSNQSQFETVEVEETTSEDNNLEAFQAREDEMLAKEIEQTLKGMPAGTEWSVSVRDLNSGRMANVNADRQMESASFYKMFLLAPLEKRLSAEYWNSYVGKQPVKDCVKAMIEISDNECPKILAEYIRWNNIDTLNHELGFKNTILNVPGGAQITTSRDMSELMYRLQNSMLLSDKARRLVFDALYEQRYRDGIPTGCGQDCLVGNKTGNLDNVKHDAAIVTHGDAKYIVVIMSKGSSDWSQVAEVAKAVDNAMRP